MHIGTTPFHAAQSRMTIAFDMVPAVAILNAYGFAPRAWPRYSSICLTSSSDADIP
jgi:hypothetical protein